MAYGSVDETQAVHDLTQLVEAKPRWESSMSSPRPQSPAEAPSNEVPKSDVVENTTSTAKTIWNIANAVQGVSIMSLPYAVLRGGWVALGGFLVVALMSNFTGKVLAALNFVQKFSTSFYRSFFSHVIINRETMLEIVQE